MKMSFLLANYFRAQVCFKMKSNTHILPFLLTIHIHQSLSWSDLSDLEHFFRDKPSMEINHKRTKICFSLLHSSKSYLREMQSRLTCLS